MRPPPRMRSIRDTIEERTKPDRVPNGRVDSESLKLYEALAGRNPRPTVEGFSVRPPFTRFWF
jgi:hypothetical protein